MTQFFCDFDFVINETLFLKNIQNYFHNKSNELSIIHGILSNSIRKVYFWLFGNTGKYTGIRSLYDSGLSRKFKINWGSKKVIFIKIHSNNSIADNLRSFGVDLSIGLDIWRVFSVAINTFQLMTPKFDSEMTFYWPYFLLELLLREKWPLCCRGDIFRYVKSFSLRNDPIYIKHWIFDESYRIHTVLFVSF